MGLLLAGLAGGGIASRITASRKYRSPRNRPWATSASRSACLAAVSLMSTGCSVTAPTLRPPLASMAVSSLPRSARGRGYRKV